MMEDDGILVQLDHILQTECFANIAPGGICLGFDHNGDARLPLAKFFGQELSFRKHRGRWDRLVRRKMPGCDRRGILTTTHSFEELVHWRHDMDTIQEARQRRKAENGGEMLREAHAEHTPDASG